MHFGSKLTVETPWPLFYYCIIFLLIKHCLNTVKRLYSIIVITNISVISFMPLTHKNVQKDRSLQKTTRKKAVYGLVINHHTTLQHGKDCFCLNRCL